MQENYKLFRCRLIRIGHNFIVGKDMFGKKYLIERNEATEYFKQGGDEQFYAILKKQGKLMKKNVLSPIRYKDYLETMENV